MRERYETLKLPDLRALAKIRGIKSITSLKKSEIIDAMVELDEKEALEKSKEAANAVSKAPEAESSKNEVTEPVVSEPDTSKGKTSEGKTSEAKADKDAHDFGPQSKGSIKKDVQKKDNASEKDKEGTAAKKHTADADPSNDHRDAHAKKHDNRKQFSKDQRQEHKDKSADPSKEENEQPQEVNGVAASGILEVMPDGFGFIRCENYLPGDNDVYVAPGIIRKLGLRTGDILEGIAREKSGNDKFGALIKLNLVNGYLPEMAATRTSFQKMTPIFPNEKLTLEREGGSIAMRIMDLICPIGKGQRGMIVSPPKAGKTTLLKDVAKSIQKNYPKIHLIILLIDERPEEVTDIKESITGENAEVIYSTFDELPEHHTRVAEMTIERARRLVEHKKDVMILIDSITRLTRAYNQVVPPSGRTLSGGLDPAALHMPKRFFGAARNMREGGSLTILATALIETGSKMDDVVYEEFKGTGNMEMILDRKLQERRIFPAINIPKSSTRREDLLLMPDELESVNHMRKGFNGIKADNAVDQVINLFSHTRNNHEFVKMIQRQML